tara:strand:- start:854 stop:2710 length:1857 start_codon:yes stop_codon:yes gene_type:complete
MSGDNPVARALGNLGQAVGQTTDIGVQLIKEQERQSLTDAEIILTKESRRIAAEIAQNFNPSEHFQKASEAFEQVTNGIIGGMPNITPRFQKDLENRMSLFTNAKLEKIGTDSQLMQVENGARLQQAKMDMQIADRDYAGALATSQAGVGTYYGKKAGEVNEMKIARMKREDGFNLQAITGDVEGIENSDLSPLDKEKLGKVARAAKARIEKDIVIDVMQMAENQGVRTEDGMRSLISLSSYYGGKEVPEHLDDEIMYHWSQTQPLDLESKKEVEQALDSLVERRKAGLITPSYYETRHHEISGDVHAMGTRYGSRGLRKLVELSDPSNWKDGKLNRGGAEEAMASVRELSSIYEAHDGFGGSDDIEEATGSRLVNKAVEDYMEETWIPQNQDLIGKPGFEEKLQAAFMRAVGKKLTGSLYSSPPSTRRMDLEEALKGREGDPGNKGREGDPGYGSVPASLPLSTSPKGADITTGEKAEMSGAKTLTDFVKGFEGWNPSAYNDYKQTSIGYGTKAKSGELSITKEEAARRLSQELQRHVVRVKKIADKGGYEFTKAQLDALTSFDYNTGKIGQVTGNGKRNKEEIAEKMLLYVKAGGKNLKGLEIRRKAEVKLFKTGY